MNLLYLDDSGSPVNQNEEYFVLGGICVPERSTRWLSHQLTSIAENIQPASPEKIEFHAAEIFSGSKTPWKDKTKTDRIQIIKQVLSVLKNANPEIVIFACAVHKQSYKGDPLLKAYEEITNRFNRYLERNSTPEVEQRGMIIIDRTSYETGLQNLAIKIRQDGNSWGNQLRQIIEIPLFVDSKACRNIQLADHIAYAVFRRYNANDINYFNVIESRFDQNQGSICGLCHWYADYHNCTCPACLTRRISSNH